MHIYSLIVVFMADKMVMGEKFKVEVNANNLHSQDRKSIAYEYFSRRYAGQKRMLQSIIWFAIAAIAGLMGIISHSIISWIAVVIMVAAIFVGVNDFKIAVEFNFEGIDWGTKNMVRIDK